MSELYPTNEYKPSQRELLETLLQPQPAVVAIEGGPCGGKSTLLAEIERQAEAIDRPVVIIPEVATPKISEWEEKTGKKIPELAANDRPEYLQFQQAILEGIVTEIEDKKAAYKGTDAIIIIDRCDIGAYVTLNEHSAILQTIGKKVPPLHEYVDRIYYLPSVAREDPDKYDKLEHTNTRRYEKAEVAIATCEANIWAVAAHPELHVAWGGNFAEKMRRVTQGVLQPELEGEIKQSMPHPDAVDLIRKSEILCMHGITQSYHVVDGCEFRLRKQTSLAAHHYFLTLKQGTGAIRTEIQRRITAEEYNLLREAPQVGNELYKTRYTFLDAVADSTGRRRLWTADTYEKPNIPRWHLETDVETEAEAEELDILYAGVRERITTGARELIFIEQK